MALVAPASLHLSRTHRSVLDYASEEELARALQCTRVVVEASSSSSSFDDEGRNTQESGNESSNDITGKVRNSLNTTTPRCSGSDWMLTTVDPASTRVLSVMEEVRRLSVLKTYLILDSEREANFDRLSTSVRLRFAVSWAGINLIDLGRQWTKSKTGTCVDSLPTTTERSQSLCAHTVQLKHAETAVLVVPDTTVDERFCDYDVVKGHPHVRFYAGAPLVTPEGVAIGSLCIMDMKARPNGLTLKEQHDLKAKAKQVVQLLVERRDRIQAMKKRRVSDPPSPSSSSVQLSPITTSPVREKPTEALKIPRNDSTEYLRSLAGDEEVTESRQASLLSTPCSSPRREEDEETEVILRPQLNVVLPDPRTSTLDPDQYLVALVQALWGVNLNIRPALDLQDYFPVISEKQMAAYTIQVVSITRENNASKLKDYYQQQGRDSLDCFNRFGEGLLNMACRRGFVDIVQFLLSPEIGLNVRIRDDYGRTPMHDACWNPEPQIQICTWLMESDPSLFLIADKRGYTPFQYARKSDWHIWREFLFERRHLLDALMRPEILSNFSK